jgi:16S rRNA (uracil1498-N3)-methyltransferase
MARLKPGSPLSEVLPMRLTRIYSRQDLLPGSEIDLEPEACRRLSQVLRLKPGAPLLLFNGDGFDYAARLLHADRRGCRLLLESRGEEEPGALLQIELALGISRPEHMDLALQKAVELGASQLQPLLLSHCNQRQSGDWQVKKARHWQQILISACEQSGRRRLPDLGPVLGLEDWLAQLCDRGRGLVLDPNARQRLADLPPPASGQPIRLLVGPEGGLADAELGLLRERGFSAIRLGPRILRTETAPLAALAALQTLWGDF